MFSKKPEISRREVAAAERRGIWWASRITEQLDPRVLQ